jgi:hypothetical protein
MILLKDKIASVFLLESGSIFDYRLDRSANRNACANQYTASSSRSMPEMNGICGSDRGGNCEFAPFNDCDD